MNKGYSLEEIGTPRFVDTMTSMNNGYMYDMPVFRHTLNSYTTFSRTSFVLNISDRKIIK